MDTTCAAAFNIQPDGSIVLDGDHAPGTSMGCPFESLSIRCTRIGAGLYQVTGPGIQPAAGWRASVYRDENDEPTVRLAIQQQQDAILYTCTDPVTKDPKDIVYLLTVRVIVTAPESEPAGDAA